MTMMTKEQIKKLDWADVIAENIPEELKDSFSRTIWFFNTGEWDYSTFSFNKEKEALLKSF